MQNLIKFPQGTKIILIGDGVDINEYKRIMDMLYDTYYFVAIADDQVAKRRISVRGINAVPFEEAIQYQAKLIILGDNWYKLMDKSLLLGYLPYKDMLPYFVYDLDKSQNVLSFSKIKDMDASTELPVLLRNIGYNKNIIVVYGGDNTSTVIQTLSYISALRNDYFEPCP